VGGAETVRHGRPGRDRARRAGPGRPLPRPGRPDRGGWPRCATRRLPDAGWYCPPAVRTDLPRDSRSCTRRSSARCWPSRPCATWTRPATASTSCPSR
jgi:hypothetical protein